MRLQGQSPKVHAPTCPPSCASKRDHFEILKHTAKVIGRKFSMGGNGKNKTKNGLINPPFTLSVLSMNIQGGTVPLTPLPTPMHTATNAYSRLMPFKI